jgi:hypothetical protein
MISTFLKIMFGIIFMTTSHLANAGLITAADQVTVDGNQWAKVDIFSGLSWNIINAQCPSGVCTAASSLNGYDLNGWNWASQLEIKTAFGVIIAQSDYDPAGTSKYEEFRSTWAPEIFRLFGSTYVQPSGIQQIWALSNTVVGQTVALFDISDYSEFNEDFAEDEGSENSSTDYIDVKMVYPKNLHKYNSAFFYKAEAEVPEPSTLTIFALGMIGLASRRFKKQS